MHVLLFWTSGLMQRNQNMVKTNVTITRKHNINSHAICRIYVMLMNCKKKQTGWTCVFNRNCIKPAIKTENLLHYNAHLLMQCLNMMCQSHNFTLFLFCFLYCGLFCNTVNISNHKWL
jgi:hypothetical protein